MLCSGIYFDKEIYFPQFIQMFTLIIFWDGCKSVTSHIIEKKITGIKYPQTCTELRNCPMMHSTEQPNDRWCKPIIIFYLLTSYLVIIFGSQRHHIIFWCISRDREWFEMAETTKWKWMFWDTWCIVFKYITIRLLKALIHY